MWTQYDEDLSQNIFFKTIKDHHNDILKKSSEEKWIICVPRTGSQNVKDNSVKTILDHVLVPQSDNSFLTLSKRCVYLKKHFLKYDDLCNIDVEVLFEETHYIQRQNKYTVWCIERPLFATQNHPGNSNNNIMLLTMHDCMDFLYSETFGFNVLELIQNLCTDFWQNEQNNFIIDNLQCQKDYIGNLYSQCLQVCYKSDILREKCNKNVHCMDNLKVAIETYMQYCLGQKLIYGINSLHHHSDSVLNKVIRNSLDASFSDLNISYLLEEELVVAKYELSRINNVFTILDKVNCLMRTFNTFNKSKKLQDQNVCLTSDDILQIFVYLLLKCNIPNWKANLSYMKSFKFSSLGSSDQSSFLVATLEGSIEFIMSSDFREMKKCSDCNQQKNSNIFYNLYNKLKTVNCEDDLINFIHLDFRTVFETIKLCHPLCSCSKCIQLSRAYVQEPLEVVNEYNQNFLILCCIENQLELVELLLNLDFDINLRDCHGKTALHYAAEKGFQDILMLLISANVDVNIVDNDKNTPLHLASDRGHVNCVSGLIYSSNFVEINLQNFSGETPLFLATKWGYIDIVKILLESGASVCLENNNKMSVFKLSPNFYITELFKQHGAANSNGILRELESDNNNSSQTMSNIAYHVDSSSVKGRNTPLHGIKPKNDLELKTVNLLFKSIENNDLPLTCFYLGYDVSDLRRDKLKLETKCHPLCNCESCHASDQTDSSDEEVQKNRVKCKFNVNMINSEGFTALHIAAKFGRTEMLRILLDSGASTNACTYGSLYTPLHLSCIYQRISTVKELLKCGDSNVNAVDSNGNTPLYYASVQNNNLKIVEMLISNGADYHKTTSTGKSILLECEEKNLFRIYRILKESLGKI